MPLPRQTCALFWTLRQYRLRHRANDFAFQRYLAAQKKEARAGRTVSKQTLKFSGGAWRAYVRRQARGKLGRADLKALAVQFAALGEEEKADLKDLGRLATQAGRQKTRGQSSFGPTSQSLQRRAETKQLLRDQQSLARASRAPVAADADAVASALAITNSTLTNVDGVARLARSDARRQHALVRAAQEADLAVIEQFQDRFREAWQQRVLRAAPELSELPARLLPWPGRVLT